jgi:hypothetical protein
MVAGISYEAASNVRINRGYESLSDTKLHRIQGKMILVIIEFAWTITAANREEIEKGFCLGIGSSWSRRRNPKAINFSKGNDTGHSNAMDVWQFKTMGEMWLTNPMTKGIVRDKASALWQAILESRWAVKQIVDTNHATKAQQRFWDGLPLQQKVAPWRGRAAGQVPDARLALHRPGS